MKKLATLVVLSLALGGTARAEIQKSGPEVWPGKIMLGVRPAGGGLVFDAGGGPGRLTPGLGGFYKVGIDIAGRLKEFSKASLWLGGEVNVGGRGNFAMIEPGVFVMVTLEKLLNIPLVPLVSFGISGPVYIPYGFNGAFLYGAFQVKFGGGVYYFLTKNIGVGADLHLGVGAGFFKDAADRLFYGFQGSADFLAGVRFAF
jgi:hypothetical protein